MLCFQFGSRTTREQKDEGNGEEWRGKERMREVEKLSTTAMTNKENEKPDGPGNASFLSDHLV